jgi:Tol biopolymer transport system component
MPSWSPNGREIVFASDRADPPSPGAAYADHLYLMNADGSGVRRLTGDSGGAHAPFLPLGETRGDARAPSFSPNGKLIAFVGSDGLDLIDADGSHRRLLTRGLYAFREFSRGLGRGYPILPTWSPNGRWIAFVNDNCGGDGCTSNHDRADLSVIRPDGAGLRRLAINISGDSLAWSPDSREIAVSGDDGRLYRIGVGAKKPRQLGSSAYAEMTDVAWSPDGAEIAYVSGVYGNVGGTTMIVNRHLWILDLQTHRLRRLRKLSGSAFSGPSDAVNITWLRGQRPLLAVDYTAGWTDLLTADGRRIGRLRNPNPNWFNNLVPGSASPNGTKLLLVRGPQNTAIAVVDVRSGRIRQLTQ